MPFPLAGTMLRSVMSRAELNLTWRWVEMDIGLLVGQIVEGDDWGTWCLAGEDVVFGRGWLRVTDGKRDSTCSTPCFRSTVDAD